MGRKLNKNKIINDPVLGFISLPYESLYDLLQHPYIQRLTRIKQLGLSLLVYPGNTHTRFIHSLGAMHLTAEALRQLKDKGNDITDEEAEATLQAILLHDIGHGPFSHALENIIVEKLQHEEITLIMMNKINKEYGGMLDLAIKIFKNEYHKKYFHQLISSQLDMDRLDYLIRDSFFSGVREGSIGAERIIKMLNVKDDKLVIEAKGIYSAENFLIARRLMYWQVYLHKTTVSAEHMLKSILIRAKELSLSGKKLYASTALQYFISNRISGETFRNSQEALEKFSFLDDSDVISARKEWSQCDDKILSYLCKSLINRRLFKVKTGETENEFDAFCDEIKKKYKALGYSDDEIEYLYSCGEVKSRTYDPSNDKIQIIEKDGNTTEISDASDLLNTNTVTRKTSKYYLCYAQVFEENIEAN
ncbi:MAG: HD domain-containing protein [Paludibacteraceae bacterium]|nr:HD domain-containing protein [Paludibacteraceae bacterium]